MAKNVQDQRQEMVLITKLQDLIKQVEKMRGPQNLFVVPLLTADPSSPVEGQIWENTTSHHLKIYLNGSVTTIV